MGWFYKKFIKEKPEEIKVFGYYSKDYNKGNDCDCCENQYLRGYGSESIGCKCADESKECNFIERKITRYDYLKVDLPVSFKEDNNMKEFKDESKAFYIPYEAWYGNTVRQYTCPYIMIGFYYQNNGPSGEFTIEWNKFGIELKVFDDAWEAFSKMPELMKLMAEINKSGKKPSIEEFTIMLKEIGYKDVTERTKQF